MIERRATPLPSPSGQTSAPAEQRRCPVLSPEVLRAIWSETAAMRAALHRVHGVRHCDTELSGPGLRLPGRARPKEMRPLRICGDCPCRDYVADMVDIAWTFLAAHGEELLNPAGAVRAHVRRRRSEPLRRRRVERGAQAKPAVVRANRYGRALPDELHRAVLESLVDEAGSAAPLDGEAQLHRRIAERCALEFGGAPAAHLAALPEVLRVIEKTCGEGPRVNAGDRTHPELVSWWEAYVQRPLGRRPRRFDVRYPDAIDTVEALTHRDSGRFGMSEVDTVIVTRVTTAVAHVPSPGHRAALAAAIRTLAEDSFIPEHLARALQADPARLDVVLARVREVLPSRTPDEPHHHTGGQR